MSVQPWRPFGWREALLGLMGASVHQVGLAWWGASVGAPFGSGRDWAAVVVFVLAAAVSTGVELARRRAFAASGGKSALCTGGAFALVRHPTFAADLAWSASWALLTGSAWAFAMAIGTTGALGAMHAFEDDRLLEKQDPVAFRSLVGRTKRLVPFLY
jgi:protein-S-isoprenylcysteine O-methyltransferase Ste14